MLFMKNIAIVFFCWLVLKVLQNRRCLTLALCARKTNEARLLTIVTGKCINIQLLAIRCGWPRT